jgi:transposase
LRCGRARAVLLFEQAGLALVREMPVLAAARLSITDTRLWRVVQYYVGQAIARFD